MRKTKSNAVLVIIAALIAIMMTSCSGERKAAVSAYDAECVRISSELDSLKETIQESQALIDLKEKPYDENTVTALEALISESSSSITEVPKMKGSAVEIMELVNNELKYISYAEENKRLSSAKNDLENSIKIMKQVTAPDEAFVIERIKNIETITGYAGVTEENDPNGNLNKPGGYTSTVYFASNQIKGNNLSQSNEKIIENGTEGGGAIEVYATEEDAKNREEYLASFDGSFLSSGSHKVVGTIVIRTSDLLTASQQQALEKQIVENLIELRD